jgi:hypothetical protein
MRVSRSRAPSSGLGEEVDEVFDFAVRGPRWVNSRPQGAPRNDRVPIGSKSALIRLILEPRREQREKRKPPARAFRTSIAAGASGF